MSIKTKIASVVAAVGTYFGGLFKGLIGEAGVSLETAIVDFIKTDVGEDALAAVEYGFTLIGQNNVQVRDAARAHLLDALKRSGKDLATIAESQLNLFIEMAYTAYKLHLV